MGGVNAVTDGTGVALAAPAATLASPAVALAAPVAAPAAPAAALAALVAPVSLFYSRIPPPPAGRSGGWGGSALHEGRRQHVSGRAAAVSGSGKIRTLLGDLDITFS